MKKQLLLPFLVLILLIVGTFGVVMYGRGYRFSFSPGKNVLSGTGLLVATSAPNGAQVFINDHLTTATDNTINLAPGTYTVRIVKQGYLPWQKTIQVDKEVVSKAEALLFPTAPKLESITADGVEKVVIDPSGSRLAFTQASGSAKQNGIYVLNMTSTPILSLQSSSKHIADDILDFFSRAFLSWSPDGSQLLATISAHAGLPTTYLLDPTQFTQNPQDVTETLISVRTDWTTQKAKKDKALIDSLKPKLIELISQNFSNTFWSPDETKIIYSASQAASLPINITPRLLGVDATPEQRNVEKGQIYVYDAKEDKNYKVSLTDKIISSVRWLPDSKHIIYVVDGQIRSMEFDGTNDTIIYAGPFIDKYVFSWPDSSKIVILTNLNNPQIPPNLYTIGLK